MDKSGNLTEYRRHLINKIGLDRVEWLEGPHDSPRYTESDLRAIRDKYRKMVKNHATL